MIIGPPVWYIGTNTKESPTAQLVVPHDGHGRTACRSVSHCSAFARSSRVNFLNAFAIIVSPAGARTPPGRVPQPNRKPIRSYLMAP